MAYAGLGTRVDRPGGIRLRIEADVAEAARALAGMGRIGPRAIARALNRTASSTLTVGRRAIAKKSGLPQKLLRSRMGYGRARASASGLNSDVHISARGILASQLHARQTRTGLSYRLGGKTAHIAHAYLAEGRRRLHAAYGAAPYSFIRVKDSGQASGLVPRLPVRYVWAGNPVAVFATEAVLDAMEARAAEQWPKEIGHQVHYYINRAIARGLRR